MINIKHLAMMIFGYILYIITFKVFDMHPHNRFFWWSLPYIGYQGYHPNNLKWYQPIERQQTN